MGPLAFRHIATDAIAEISGHYHPKHRLAGRSRPAFLLDQSRMILPAYGAYTGGLNVLDPAIAGLFPRGFQVQLLGRDAIYSFPRSALSY